jgi:tripartite-type tricarboxylate transporter receptor subunit TctC
MFKKYLLTAGLGLAATVLLAAPAWAWPDKRIDLVVPFAAGGGIDQTLLPFARLLEAELGVPVVLVNREGASGQIGWEHVHRLSDPSHTIAALALPHFVNTTIFSNPEYGIDDFVPLGLLVEEVNIWFTHKDAPWKDMRELIADARARPGEITLAISGTSGDNYLSVILTEQEAGVDFRVVNVSGGGQVMTNVAGRQMDVGVSRPGTILALKDELRGLGVATEERVATWPETPTFDEQIGEYGIPNFRLSRGLMVSAAFVEQNPQAYERLVAAVAKIAAEPGFAEQMEKLGLDVRYLDPDAAAERIRTEADAMATHRELIIRDRQSHR